jgi:predicted RNase H-like nuclease (RuvC/YqgF family)
MKDIEDLNSRIMAAMERIAGGLDGLGSADAGEAEALRAALEEEKQANAQLGERVRVLGERHQQAIAAMEARRAEAEERTNRLDTELQQYRKAHEMLSDACEALRTANAEGVGDAGLINQALEAELEALRAIRRAELAEADEIIASLMPLLSASAQTQQQEEA